MSDLSNGFGQLPCLAPWIGRQLTSGQMSRTWPSTYGGWCTSRNNKDNTLCPAQYGVNDCHGRDDTSSLLQE
jgi:hypothetical protein